jgi:hypothetical protein
MGWSGISALADFLTNPPATLICEHRDRWNQVKRSMTLERPDGFTAETKQNYRPQDYVTEFYGRRRDIESDIKVSRDTLTELRKRLADWKPKGA